MSRSIIAVIVAVIIGVVVVVGVIVGFSNTDLSPAAVRVNGDEVSQQELNSELKGFADSPFFAQPYAQAQPPVSFKVSDGAISSLAGAQWLGYRIESALVDEVLASEHIKVTQSDLDKARTALNSQGVLAGMSDSAANQITRLQASLTKLVAATSVAEARTAVQKAARKAHVTIDERYGTWNRKALGVCPRPGCTRAVSVLPPAQQQ
jgi:hypothetical protein